jgi:cytochrome c biogenesis protein CcmG, thiol:disulfide interchange protein DsbE
VRLRTTLILLLILPLACKRAEKTADVPKAESAATAATSTSTVVDVGSMMPAYTAASLDGTTFDVAAERGNVMLINLWATWCGPCRFEIPELQKLHDENASRRFKVVGVSVDEGERKVVQDFVTEQKMTYPVVHDPDGKLAVLFDTSILPTSVIVDRTGKVVWKHLGIVRATDAEMLKALDAALKM